jgi:PAS domain S-box-containing protein
MMKAKIRILNLEDNVNDGALNDAMISARWPECEYVRVVGRDDFVAALDAGGFDLILSDFSLPGFDGREALKLAQEKLPEVPFLFVSGTIGEDVAVEVLKQGATDYVLKHRLVRLIPAVDRALREVEERAECERAEEAMRQSEHKYRELFECLGDAAFLADETAGKIIDTNRRAEAVLGCTRSGILGHKQSEFLTLDKAPIANGAPEANASVPVTFQCEMIRTDGTTVPVEVRATRLTLYERKLVLRLCRELAQH